MSTTSSTKSSQPSNDALSARLTEGVAKEVRAHEHARNRTKERREHVQVKERKERAAVARATGIKVSQGLKPVKGLSMDSWDGDEEAVVGHETLPPKPPALKAVAPPARFGSLTLGDLISIPRRKKAKQLDFEVIPPVRAVIALDDCSVNMEVDEPWEYISRASLNDEPSWKAMSYAQAAATAL
ncbi:hypothetical protein F5I97DRAFT_1243320 [Phlebopus sp. FC_14]|nr:hypothetical protein F5I97DRAFT_1243320 [Phlebopus sp. FC_14]